MNVELIDDSKYLTQKQTNIIQNVIALAGIKLGVPETIEVDISIVDNETIHQLNLAYRQVDRPTDVLSFALEESTDDFDIPIKGGTDLFGRHLGDLIISYPKAVEQAEDYGHSLERELAFLSVHGFLHLNGYDHQTEEEEKEMFAIQEEVLADYGLSR